MKKPSWLFLLIIIILLGAVLRFVATSAYPPSLNWDEVSIGYNSYSIFKTGHDEWGVFFPTIFRAFGDYKLPVYLYSDVPFVGLLGLTSLAVRLPSILAGICLIPLSFLLAYHFFADKKTALLTALLVSISPWTLFLSRVAVEANLAALLICLGLYLGLKKQFSLAAVFLGLSAWTYNSARFFAPAIILLSIFKFRRQIFKHLRPLLICAIFIAPMFVQFLMPEGRARLDWLTILDSGALAQIAQSRSVSHFPFPRLIYNKATYFTVHFASNYFSYFSPNFLFLKGGSQYQFNIPEVGLLFPICLVFFYFGLLIILIKKFPGKQLLWLWLVLAPVAGSITRDSPHTLRAITLLPLPMLISAFGLTEFIKLKSILRIPVIVIFLIGSLFYFQKFTQNYLDSYPTTYSWAWQYGYPQVISYIKSHYQDYDSIIFTKRYGEPHEFVLFYWPWDPRSYVGDPALNRYYKSEWYWVDSFANFHFVNDWEMSKTVSDLKISGKYLIISSPDSPVAGQVLETVNFMDHKPAFVISEKTI